MEGVNAKSTGKTIFVFIFSILFLSAIISSYFVTEKIQEDDNILRDSDGWLIGEPEDFGFNETKLQFAYNWANSNSYMRSVLIVRHGVLVAEWYFNDGSRYNAYHIHSASKSFMSTLIGLAHYQNYIPDLDRKMMDYFPEYEYLNLDPWKYNITIRHLLAMKGGLDFDDMADDWRDYTNSSDWVRYALELPKSHDPGEDWDYSTPQTNLLSVILTKATGMSSKQFADLHLFNPLDISISYWSQDPQGYYTGGHEMYFTPRAMARYGLLYLNNGTYEGNEIVPKDWVIESIQNYEYGNKVESLISYILFSTAGYGYQWWTATFSGHFCYMAKGCCGQIIFCIPSLDMVVVTTATGTIMDYPPNYYQGGAIENFVVNNIFPAINPNT